MNLTKKHRREKAKIIEKHNEKKQRWIFSKSMQKPNKKTRTNDKGEEKKIKDDQTSPRFSLNFPSNISGQTPRCYQSPVLRFYMWQARCSIDLWDFFYGAGRRDARNLHRHRKNGTAGTQKKRPISIGNTSSNHWIFRAKREKHRSTNHQF